MKHFRTPTTGRPRRHPRPTARDLAVGHDNAKAINRGTTTIHLRPVRAGDHVKRYKPDQTLNIRAFVGGPTWCRITIITAERVPLTHALNLANARRAGHRTSSELAAAFEQSYGQGRTDRQVWAITFKLDATEAPRLLAASGDAPSSYKLGSDGRWHYVERHDERDTDRGYTSTESRALREEMPALSDEDHKRHVQANIDLEHAQWVALGRMASLDEKRRPHKHQRKAA